VTCASGDGRTWSCSKVDVESIALADVVPTDRSSIPIRTRCKARRGDREGVGVLEQLAFGPHAPTGLTGLTDGYTPS
jgi:hypothetical protein